MTPEASEGGTIALVNEGDTIRIDIRELALTLEVGEDELASRHARWRAPAPRYRRGVLAKFARDPSSASTGVVLDADTPRASDLAR